MRETHDMQQIKNTIYMLNQNMKAVKPQLQPKYATHANMKPMQTNPNMQPMRAGGQADRTNAGRPAGGTNAGGRADFRAREIWHSRPALDLSQP